MKLVILAVIVFHCTAQVFNGNVQDSDIEVIDSIDGFDPNDQVVINVPTCQATRYTYSLSVKMCQVPTSSGPVTQLTREDSLKIKNLYPGVFRSYRLSPILKRSSRPSWYYRKSCCKTYESHIAERSLTNLDGKERELVHLRSLSLFQYVRTGRCGKCPSWRYRCVPKKTLQYFMVYNKPYAENKPPITFEAFEVPTYCECFQRSWRLG